MQSASEDFLSDDLYHGAEFSNKHLEDVDNELDT
jgi:hypothetical protein